MERREGEGATVGGKAVSKGENYDQEGKKSG
jgi:hypothetical protein